LNTEAESTTATTTTYFRYVLLQRLCSCTVSAAFMQSGARGNGGRREGGRRNCGWRWHILVGLIQIWISSSCTWRTG